MGPSRPDFDRPESTSRRSPRSTRLRILLIASEVSPWAKTGGLADVTAALPEALEALGHDVTTVLPKYRGSRLADAGVLDRQIRLGATTYDVRFHIAQVSPRRRVVLVDVPALFDRDGYYGAGGRDFADNSVRFGLLAAAALEFAEQDAGAQPIDVVHTHDWPAALAGAFLRALPERYPRLRHAGVVFTIHNLAYQGLFPKEDVPALGLPWRAFAVETGEFYGQFSFLKAGLTSCDYLTTVSPSYARETQRAESGCGLGGVLRSRRDRYVGILNGIDTRVWNPAADEHLPAAYDAEHPAGKAVCKRALLERFHFALGDDRLARPIVSLVSRLVEQKGIDAVLAAAEALADLDATWIFMGVGEARFEAALEAFAKRFPARVGVHIGFSETLAHLIAGGSDIFLMPSRFEPCGLYPMYSLRYGTVPVVHGVGGLDDTIQPYTARAIGANGFKFRRLSVEDLVRTLRQAIRLYANKAVWRPLMRNGMTTDHSWETSAREYVKVYRRARQAAATRTAW